MWPCPRTTVVTTDRRPAVQAIAPQGRACASPGANASQLLEGDGVAEAVGVGEGVPVWTGPMVTVLKVSAFFGWPPPAPWLPSALVANASSSPAAPTCL